MEGDVLVGIEGEDVKWKTKEEVIHRIIAAENYLRITVVTPIRTRVTNKKSSESESERYNSKELESVSSSSKVIKVFPPSDSRRSLSSSLSSVSDFSLSSGSDKFRTFRKKRPWSVLKILDHM